MKLIVDVSHFKDALIKLLEGEKISADFLQEAAGFYVHEILAGARERDIHFSDLEMIDDPALPTFRVEGAESVARLLEALAEIKGPAFNSAYEYAVRRFIRGIDKPGDPQGYTQR